VSGGGGGGGGGRVNVRIGGSNPFSPQDQWAVAPDGRVAIVYANDYHIEWIDANGRKTASPPIRFERLKVTEAHKQAWRDARRSTTGLMVRVENGKQTAQSVPMTNAPEPTDWPEYLPPFLAGALSFSPDGMLWVRRTGPAQQGAAFDLVDRAGRVTQQVVLPKRSNLLGFGSNGAVYVVRLDEDDLQYLQRFRFTPTERP
jgi:hypothetical protein